MLGVRQKIMLAALRDRKSDIWGSRSETIRIYESLSRRGLARQMRNTSDSVMPIFMFVITEAGRNILRNIELANGSAN